MHSFWKGGDNSLTSRFNDDFYGYAITDTGDGKTRSITGFCI